MAAAVASAPKLSVEYDAEPPRDDVAFYGSLDARAALPYLAVSGNTGRGMWIGSPPEPPEDDGETTDEDSDEDSDDGADVDLQDWQVAKQREERKDIALEMARLWKENPKQWLIKSKVAWAIRHESKRKRTRHDIPTINADRIPAGEFVKGEGRTTKNSERAGTVGAPKRPARSGVPGRSTVSLKMLVDDSKCNPGHDALWITYQNQTWSGELSADGIITFQGKTFNSPSAWAIYVKRLANPGKKADDGWKSVRYGHEEGPMLDDLKHEYLRGESGAGLKGSSGGGGGGGAGMATKPQQRGATATPETTEATATPEATEATATPEATATDDGGGAVSGGGTKRAAEDEAEGGVAAKAPRTDS